MTGDELSQLVAVVKLGEVSRLKTIDAGHAGAGT